MTLTVKLFILEINQVSGEKNRIRLSHPVPPTLGLSGPTTLHLFPSGWKNFNYHFYQERTIQTALDLSSNVETTLMPMDNEAHLTCEWKTSSALE